MKAVALLSGVILMMFSCSLQHIENKTKQLTFSDSDRSYCHIYADTLGEKNEMFIADSFSFKNITYSRVEITNDKGNNWYVVKKTSNINFMDNADGHHSAIELDIYNFRTTKLVNSIIKDADDVSIHDDYISTIKYGCCDENNTGELITVWDDRTLLKYDTRYFCIQMADDRIRLFFGYVCNPGERDSTKGILYYLIAIGKHIEGCSDNVYSYKYHEAGKVVFKSKPGSSDVAEEIYHLSSGISLIKNSKNDWQSNDQYSEKLYLYSLGHKATLNDINITPLQIKTWNDTAHPILIPIIHGYLFGDSTHTERTIYIK